MAWFRKQGDSDRRSSNETNSRTLDDRVRNLEKTVAQYERIFRGSSHGYAFLDWDVKNSHLDWHGNLWVHLGYSESDMEHLSNAEEFPEFVHPDDRQKLSNAVHAHLRGLGAGEVIFRLRKKRGGHIWTEVRVDAVRDAKGWVKYVSGVVFDISKLKQTEQALLISEARHARIIQSSNDGIWEWSAELGGYHFSTRCWEHLGFTAEDEVVNQGIDRLQIWRQRMHDEDRMLFDDAMKKHIEQREPFDVVYRIKGKDDKWRWIRARGQMAYNNAGKPTRMSGTNMDVTEIKHAEERVLMAKDAAEEANKAKSDFLSSMSHELRTPLNAILGFAQLFEMDRNLTKDQTRNVSEIKRAGEHLLQLVGDVLDLARIESGRIGLTLEKVSPAGVLKDVQTLLKSHADAAGVQVNLQCDCTGRFILADPVRLKQVFINIISNAIKYNREGGSVVIDCTGSNDERLHIDIIDTGYGIPERLQKHVFEPFNRLGAEGSNIIGSGVGLVITRQLVEQMNGAIGFASVEGRGSTFWVEFPVLLGDTAENAARGRAINEFGREVPDLLVLATKQILYVEDNPPNQRLMKQLLVRYPNLKLEITGEPLRGIYLARTTHPDLIIMDINLPGMDGFEMVEVLKNDPATKSIPVVALTVNAMAEDIEKGKACGFDYYLTKPLELHQIIDVFNDLLI